MSYGSLSFHSHPHPISITSWHSQLVLLSWSHLSVKRKKKKKTKHKLSFKAAFSISYLKKKKSFYNAFQCMLVICLYWKNFPFLPSPVPWKVLPEPTRIPPALGPFERRLPPQPVLSSHITSLHSLDLWASAHALIYKGTSLSSSVAFASQTSHSSTTIPMWVIWSVLIHNNHK